MSNDPFRWLEEVESKEALGFKTENLPLEKLIPCADFTALLRRINFRLLSNNHKFSNELFLQ